ncbi:hypothetical protein K7432_010306 [Basidiobolus ranarum]|uniref:Uncharacterized protein n=1 Tax=Basidiobolus ranarum TaxID=34480 RepID=A0ABR2VVN4_9FUNG
MTGTVKEEENSALAIQKAFRGYRARRELQGMTLNATRWKELLGFVQSQLRTTDNLEDLSPSEKAKARWQRAHVLSSKLGKGALSIESNPLFLLTEHWLECVDGEHRYGSNLLPYFQYWQNQKDTTQNFFYWLDYGDGQSLDLEERPRERLMKEKIKYCSYEEREAFRVCVDPKTKLLTYVRDGTLVHTLPDSVPVDANVDEDEFLPENDPNDDAETRKAKKVLRNKHKYIYVLSPDNHLYIHRKVKGYFQHSSIMAGQSVAAAGGICVNHGRLVTINPHSGHYQPKESNFASVVDFLKAQNVDFTNTRVKNPFAENADSSSEQNN